MNQRKLMVDRNLQLREAIMTAGVAIIAINLTILWSTLISVGKGVLEFNFTYTHYVLVALFELSMLCLLFFLAMRRTAKVVGPVKAITRELTRLGQGDLSAEIRLRKGDAFADEAQIINLAAKALRERIQRMEALCSKIEAVSEEKQIDTLVNELRAELAGIKTVRDDKNTLS